MYPRIRVPAELKPTPPQALEDYVRLRITQYISILSQRLSLHAPGLAKEVLDRAAGEALAYLPQGDHGQLSLEDKQLQLVFRHDCLALGCLDPQCALCTHNPSRRCTVNFDRKYLVNDVLKARCGAGIRVELIDPMTGQPVEEKLPEITLQISVLDGNLYDNKFLDSGRQYEGGTEPAEELDACALLQNKKKSTALLVCGSGGSNDAQGYVLLTMMDGKVPLNDLHVTDSSEAILSGRKPPFRLLVRALLPNSGPRLNIRHAVSEGFVVATRRTRTAGKADIPSVDDPVSKLEHMGKETVKKLADLATAAEQAGVEIDIPENCVLKVGEFKMLALRADQDGHLRQKLQHVLKLSKEKWDEARDHAMRAVVADNRMRAWYADRRSCELGVLFTARMGNVDLDRPVGLLQTRVEAGERKTEAILVAQLNPTQREMLRAMQPQAVAAWWAPGHTGWAIFPMDSDTFLQTGTLTAALPPPAALASAATGAVGVNVMEAPASPTQSSLSLSTMPQRRRTGGSGGGDGGGVGPSSDGVLTSDGAMGGKPLVQQQQQQPMHGGLAVAGMHGGSAHSLNSGGSLPTAFGGGLPTAFGGGMGSGRSSRAGSMTDSPPPSMRMPAPLPMQPPPEAHFLSHHHSMPQPSQSQQQQPQQQLSSLHSQQQPMPQMPALQQMSSFHTQSSSMQHSQHAGLQPNSSLQGIPSVQGHPGLQPNSSLQGNPSMQQHTSLQGISSISGHHSLQGNTSLQGHASVPGHPSMHHGGLQGHSSLQGHHSMQGHLGMPGHPNQRPSGPSGLSGGRQGSFSGIPSQSPLGPPAGDGNTHGGSGALPNGPSSSSGQVGPSGMHLMPPPPPPSMSAPRNMMMPPPGPPVSYRMPHHQHYRGAPGEGYHPAHHIQPQQQPGPPQQQPSQHLSQSSAMGHMGPPPPHGQPQPGRANGIGQQMPPPPPPGQGQHHQGIQRVQSMEAQQQAQQQLQSQQGMGRSQMPPPSHTSVGGGGGPDHDTGPAALASASMRMPSGPPPLGPHGQQHPRHLGIMPHSLGRGPEDPSEDLPSRGSANPRPHKMPSLGRADIHYPGITAEPLGGIKAEHHCGGGGAASGGAGGAAAATPSNGLGDAGGAAGKDDGAVGTPSGGGASGPVGTPSGKAPSPGCSAASPSQGMHAGPRAAPPVPGQAPPGATPPPPGPPPNPFARVQSAKGPPGDDSDDSESDDPLLATLPSLQLINSNAFQAGGTGPGARAAGHVGNGPSGGGALGGGTGGGPPGPHFAGPSANGGLNAPLPSLHMIDSQQLDMVLAENMILETNSLNTNMSYGLFLPPAMAMGDGAGLLQGTQSKELLKPTTSGLDTMASIELALPGVRKNEPHTMGQQEQKAGGNAGGAVLSHGLMAGGSTGVGVGLGANRTMGPYAR